MRGMAGLAPACQVASEVPPHGGRQLQIASSDHRVEPGVLCSPHHLPRCDAERVVDLHPGDMLGPSEDGTATSSDCAALTPHSQAPSVPGAHLLGRWGGL